jgi:hypothetical protein
MEGRPLRVPRNCRRIVGCVQRIGVILAELSTDPQLNGVPAALVCNVGKSEFQKWADAHTPILFVPVHDSGTEVAIPVYFCAKGATILAAIKASGDCLMPLVTSGGPRLKKSCIKPGSQRMDACWRMARPGPLPSNRHARHEQSNGYSQQRESPPKSPSSH